MGFDPPLGASYGFHANETLFGVFTGIEAEAVSLVFLNSAEHGHPSKVIPMESNSTPDWTEGTGKVWYTSVPNVPVGQLYGYTVAGPWDPKNGHRYNPNKILCDPYAMAIGRRFRWAPQLRGHEGHDDLRMSTESNILCCPLGAVVEHRGYDWQDDRHPNIPWTETVIYEVHVKGFTAGDPSVDQKFRGTYSGFMRMIDYLVKLGVTAVELMPICSAASGTPERSAYWGYDTLALFAPNPDYSAYQNGEARITELKDMIRALHAAGIEVILDMVFNHTVEGNHLGPTLSLRGLANGQYYRLCGSEHEGRYRYYRQDRTGCGNELRIESPVVLKLLLDCLRYWITELHADGFRFDLASALTVAGENHSPDCAFLKAVAQDPDISQMKLVAEPWSAADHQIGGFGFPWAEWNDRFRDATRRFWRGDEYQAEVFRDVLLGSTNLFPCPSRGSARSLNFVTCHDGFTMDDLVSYAQKHNEENGEGNRDGSDNNNSENFGIEGPSADRTITRGRKQQKRNFFSTLLLSRGTPMILGGDEIGRTQKGNNNAYCQDNEIAWYHRLRGDTELFEFVSGLIRLRMQFPALRCSTAASWNGFPDEDEILFFLPDGSEVPEEAWLRPEFRTFGVRYLSPSKSGSSVSLYLLFNASRNSHADFLMPGDPRNCNPYQRILDTFDEHHPLATVTLRSNAYTLQARSMGLVKRVR